MARADYMAEGKHALFVCARWSWFEGVVARLPAFAGLGNMSDPLLGSIGPGEEFQGPTGSRSGACSHLHEEGSLVAWSLSGRTWRSRRGSGQFPRGTGAR